MELEHRQAHWQAAYAIKGEHGVSWFQDEPQPSLGLIEQVAAGVSAVVVDIGGGASRLADGLLDRNFQDVTVLDLSETSLAASQARLGPCAGRVRWIIADVTTWVPPRAYDVWHDRATFHFLTEPADRAAYLARLMQALRPGGHAIIATFAPDGPERCSSLTVVRYHASSLGRTLGPAFKLIGTQQHVHTTPLGAPQAFQFSVFRRASSQTS